MVSEFVRDFSIVHFPKEGTENHQDSKKENLQRATPAPSNPTVDLSMLERLDPYLPLASLWPVKDNFENMTALVEVTTFLSNQSEKMDETSCEEAFPNET